MRPMLKKCLSLALATLMLCSLLGLFTLPTAAGNEQTYYYDGSYTIVQTAGDTPNCHDMTLSVDTDSVPKFDAITYLNLYSRANPSDNSKPMTGAVADYNNYITTRRAFLVNAATAEGGSTLAAAVGAAFDDMLEDLRAEAARYGVSHGIGVKPNMNGFTPTFTVTYSNYYWQRYQATPSEIYNSQQIG